MGTRGIVGFVHQGKELHMYNHHSSSPLHLGLSIFEFCQLHAPAAMRFRVGQLVAVGDENPTEQQVTDAAKVLDLCQATIDDYLARVQPGAQEPLTWDLLLSEVSGHSLSYFMTGLNWWPDYEGFIFHSNCEWAYIINLDTEKLEIYTHCYNAPGHVMPRYPKRKPTGRYAGLDRDEDGEYRGATLVDEIPLGDLRILPQQALSSYAARIDRQF